MSAETWRPFGVPDEAYTDTGTGQKILSISWRRPKSGQQAESTADPAARWLRSALIGLGVLAAAAAAVSFAAQFQLVYAAKGVTWAAALEAAIPDAGAVVFACLGIALALKGNRAIRARGGNLACVGLSLGMNLIAAHAGWRSIAIWVMPSAVYAFASDTLIGVIRAYVLAKLGKADDGRSAWTGAGRVALYALRFLLAARSTSKGLRRLVLNSAPVPDAARTAVTSSNVAALAAAPTPASAAIPTTSPEPEPQVTPTRAPRGGSKRAQLVDAYEALQGTDARYGDRSQVSPVARELAPDASLAWSSARTILYRHLDGKAASS